MFYWECASLFTSSFELPIAAQFLSRTSPSVLFWRRLCHTFFNCLLRHVRGKTLRKYLTNDDKLLLTSHQPLTLICTFNYDWVVGYPFGCTQAVDHQHKERQKSLQSFHSNCFDCHFKTSLRVHFTNRFRNKTAETGLFCWFFYRLWLTSASPPSSRELIPLFFIQ